MQLIMSLGNIDDGSSIDSVCMVYDKVTRSKAREKEIRASVRDCRSILN